MQIILPQHEQKMWQTGRGHDSGNINDDRKNILLRTAVSHWKTVSQYLDWKVCIQDGLGWWKTGEGSATMFVTLSVCLKFSHLNHRLKLARSLLRGYFELETAQFSRAMQRHVIQLYASTLAWRDGQDFPDSNTAK